MVSYIRAYSRHRGHGCVFWGKFSEKRAFCLLAPPKHMSFLTIFNESSFSKTQGTVQQSHPTKVQNRPCIYIIPPWINSSEFTQFIPEFQINMSVKIMKMSPRRKYLEHKTLHLFMHTGKCKTEEVNFKALFITYPMIFFLDWQVGSHIDKQACRQILL